MNAALEFELLKARRAGVFRWGALVVVVGVPALCAAFFELVRLGGDSPSAAKAATLITELSWPASSPRLGRCCRWRF